jgi:hypothetical protein
MNDGEGGNMAKDEKEEDKIHENDVIVCDWNAYDSKNHV